VANDAYIAGDIGNSLNIRSGAAGFGGSISDSDREWAACREPICNRVTFGVALDMFDKWFTVDDPTTKKADVDLDTKAQYALELLDAKSTFMLAEAYAAIHGYSLIVLGCDDAQNTESLKNPRRKGSKITHLAVYRKTEIGVYEQDTAPNSPRYGEPLTYKLSRAADKQGAQANNQQLYVHYSRVIRVSMFPDETSIIDIIWDDATILRNMRWGMGQTLFRYGPGFPVFKFHDTDNTKLAARRSDIQANWLNWTFICANEGMDVDFKGAAGSALNPTPYYDPVFDNLSVATSIPSAILKGTNAGALTGSETNISDYFKVISRRQSLRTSNLCSLLNVLFESGQIPSSQSPLDAIKKRVLRLFGKDAESHYSFKIRWNPGFEPTEKDRATVDLLFEQAQQIRLGYMTKDEVRAEADLAPLPDGEGAKMSQPQPAAFNPFNQQPQGQGQQEQNLQQSQVNPQSQSQTKPQDQHPVQPNVTLPILLKSFVMQVIEGTLTLEDALTQGTKTIEAYTRLEEQNALMWVRSRTGQNGAVTLSPEMQQQLSEQHARLIAEYKAMLQDAQKLNEKNKQPQ